MIQSLHIFRKDLRHLWPDLSLYATLLIAASITIPMGWNEAAASNTALRTFTGFLQILIPILWLVLIARLIHDESLVGDTQFWITRPYKWTSLLSAKLLFILLCLVVPFALTQWAIVLQAGLNPLHTIAGQSLNLLSDALIAWLPFIAVAAVTSTVQRMFMWMLAVVIFWGAVLTMLGSSTGPRMPLPFATETLAIVIGGLLIGILLYQYATRNSLRSRIALITTTVLFVGLFWCLVEGAIPGLTNGFIRHHYPVSSNASLRLAFDSSSIPSQDTGEGEPVIGTLLLVRLPVSMQGLDPTDQLDDQNVSFTMDAPGYHYTSPWRPADIEQDSLLLFVPQKMLDKAHGSNVRMHISEIAQRFLPGTPQTVTAANDFIIPGDGTCHMLPNLSGNNVSCRYPFRIASRVTIHAAVSNGACKDPGSTHPGITTIGARSRGTGLDPTIDTPLHLGGAICPGTQLTFTPYHPAENFRLELDIPSISLNRYLVR
jgi:hypothetical protein